MDKPTTKAKSVFETLNAINVNEHTETKKTGSTELTYLSWAWAWGELLKVYPDATYEITKYGENRQPYFYDMNLGYMCHTTMTIDGIEREMWLPVMNGANKAMKAAPYTYKVYNSYKKTYEEKVVEAATMFDINKTIMRCLVKNIGMFGLGLYIYAGEDLPESETLTLEKALDRLKKCTNKAEVTALWNEAAQFNNALCAQNGEFYNAVATALNSLPEQ